MNTLFLACLEIVEIGGNECSLMSTAEVKGYKEVFYGKTWRIVNKNGVARGLWREFQYSFKYI